MSSTSLTPSMKGLLREDPSGISDHRRLVADALKKDMTETAIFLAEELVTSTEATFEDRVLFAKCFYRNGEYRGCLAALERNNLLSAQELENVAIIIRPESEKTLAMPSNVKLLHAQIDAVLLASRCLFQLEQYEDCLSLLESVLLFDATDPDRIAIMIEKCKLLWKSGNFSGSTGSLNSIAALYSVAGRCFDRTDNRARAVSYLGFSVAIDAACTESLEYICRNGLMTIDEKKDLFERVNFVDDRSWLRSYYRFMLLGDTEYIESISRNDKQPGAIQLIRRAQHLLDNLQQAEEAYRLIRQAYALDPFDKRCIEVYISCLADLNLKTELFFLAHELITTYPKLALSWYAVGCYYWICKKLELSQNFLQKSVKMDKHFPRALIALGHVLSGQEESELAVSAFRAAARQLPGDNRPILYMAKELSRTNYLSLALHLLNTALDISPGDVFVLNEMGVIMLRLNRYEEAIDFLSQAAETVLSIALGRSFQRYGATQVKRHEQAERSYAILPGGEEIFNNLATSFRRCGRLHEALEWYERSLAENPLDAGTVASLAFTLHLMRRYDEAITAYHRSLALESSAFCADMLTRAVADAVALPYDTGLSAAFNPANAQHGSPEGDWVDVTAVEPIAVLSATGNSLDDFLSSEMSTLEPDESRLLGALDSSDITSPSLFAMDEISQAYAERGSAPRARRVSQRRH